jgi:hypothetical protein
MMLSEGYESLAPIPFPFRSWLRFRSFAERNVGRARNAIERRRAEGPAARLAQPEGLGRSAPDLGP